MYRRTVLLVAVVLLSMSRAFSQTVWHKYESNPILVPNQEWEAAFGVIGPRLLKVGNVYKMWYTGLGSRRQIGLATSLDGIHWTKLSNPVLSFGKPGDFDSEHVTYGKVLHHNNQYWMWYSGYNGTIWQIGLATSSDGVIWTKYANNPVLTVGRSNEWDAQGVIAPAIIFDGRIFKMWYNGNGTPFIQAGGYAESADGIHWQKHQRNPIFTPIPSIWESRTIGLNAVIFENGEYHLWYGAGGDATNALGYATSKDGINWTRYQSNPIMTPGKAGAWDYPTLDGFNIMRENNVYKMWYGGYDGAIWRIGYATSQIIPTPSSRRLIFLPRVYGLPGDTIAVALSADSIAGISGGDVIIKFDSEVLAAINVQPTEFTRNFLIAANLDTPGIARLSLASIRGAEGGFGGLFNLHIVVNPSLTIPDTVFSRPLKLAHAVFYTEDSKPISIIKRNGEFILGRSRGDVNRDGHINAADAILTLRIATGLIQPTPEQLADADVDANGRVESLDASCILHRAVGLECPAGGNSNVAANLLIAPFSIGAGNQIETRLSVNGIEKLLGGDLSLQFNANALEITDIQPSPEMSGVTFMANLNNAGQAKFSFAATGSIQTKNIAVIRLRAKTQIDEKSLRSNGATFFDAQGRRWNGVITSVDESPLSDLPTAFSLEQNYPNPIYRQSATAPDWTNTQIRYTLPQRRHVKLIIYDLYGRQVRLLEDAEKSAGSYLQIWNGLDEFGHPVASGVYIYRLQIGQSALARKMLIFE